MAYPKKVWVKLNRPEGEVNLRDKQGRDIGDVPEGTEITVLGIDSQGRYIPEAFIASSVCQDTDPKESTWVWPVGNPLHRINHKFNEPRSYGRHEGVDLEARLGDALYAVRAGIVRKVWTWQGGKTGNNAYGNWLIIEHDSGGYSTMYCHMQRFAAGLIVGRRVNRGQEIGKAGSTGNSTAAHLHLTVTHPVLGLGGYVWPKVVNPEPLLANAPSPIPTPVYATLPEGHALKGVHSPADPGAWAYTQPVLNAIQDTHMDAVFVLCPEADPATIDKIRAQGVSFIAARLFAHMGERRGDTIEQRANWFIAEVKQSAIALYAKGIRYYQLHNEPNLLIEGLGSNWNNGIEFTQFYNYVVSVLKISMPQAKFGFPGLSPGATVPGVRQDSTLFFSQAQQAVNQSDWLGLHQYFGNEGVTYGSAVQSIAKFCNEHRDKVVLLTEFSNSNREVAKAIKGQEYKAFYVALKTQTPPNLGAAFAFVVSSTSGFEHETFVEKDGTHSAIVHALS